MKRTTSVLNIADVIAWAAAHDIPHAGTRKFEFVVRTLGPTICPRVRNYTDKSDNRVINWLGWSRDCFDARTVAALHIFDWGGELHEPGQIGRPGPRHIRPSRHMLNDCPIVLNDPDLEELLSELHGLRGRFFSARPRRLPLCEHVRRSGEAARSFDTARCIVAAYRWLVAHHPNAKLREPDGRRTFAAIDLTDRFRDEFDWDDAVAIRGIHPPSPRRGSVYRDRDFRVRQFVDHMRSRILFGMERQQAVALAARIATAFPGTYPLSRQTIESILDRRPAEPGNNGGSPAKARSSQVPESLLSGSGAVIPSPLTPSTQLSTEST